MKYLNKILVLYSLIIGGLQIGYSQTPPYVNIFLEDTAPNVVTLKMQARGTLSGATAIWGAGNIVLRITPSAMVPIVGEFPGTSTQVTGSNVDGYTALNFNDVASMSAAVTTYDLNQRFGVPSDGFVYIQIQDPSAIASGPLANGQMIPLFTFTFPMGWTCVDCIQIVTMDIIGTNTDESFILSNLGSNPDYLITDGSGSLPIELLTFEPRTDKCDAYLYWETATERNFGYFQIEASKDGRDFKALAQQKPASSNSSEKRTYKYSIPSAYQGYYFRLKAVDLDGAFDYSDIVATETPCTKAYEVQLYPNPVNQWLQVQLDGGQQDEIYELTVLNLLGQRVPMPRTQVRKGELHRLDTTDWTPGAYWLQLRTERGEIATTIPFAKIN